MRYCLVLSAALCADGLFDAVSSAASQETQGLYGDAKAVTVTCHHDIEHDTTGPDVCFFAIILISHEHFRSNIVRRAADGLRPGIHKLVLTIAEVTDLDIGLRLGIIQQGILKLYIPGQGRREHIAAPVELSERRLDAVYLQVMSLAILTRTQSLEERVR